MGTTIKIPKRINVGYQNRSGTYTGKLAYVIYFDEKGVLRKETSWNGWRDKNIPNEEFDNVPTSGFVLNKKVGGYDTGWNHRQTYTRVYDPRNFEFEITVENLLFILENATSTKGKGLEGDFVYGWDGKDLILIPCDSPDYKEIREYTSKIENKEKITLKNIKVGGRYLTKKNEEVIYIGRFDCYKNKWANGEYKITNCGKEHFYAVNKKYDWEKESTWRFNSSSGLSFLIETISDECCEEYSEIFSKFEYCESYNPFLGEYKKEYLTLEEFKEKDSKKERVLSFLSDCEDKTLSKFNDRWGDKSHFSIPRSIEDNDLFRWGHFVKKTRKYYGWSSSSEYEDFEYDCTITLDELYYLARPYKKIEYLKDGKVRREYSE